MFIHTVYFWLKPDLSEEDRASFRLGVESLGGVETIRFFHVGAPADTDRPVIDRTYSVALLVAFDDKAGHDVYQVHPTHLAFVAAHKEKWHRLQIYDSE